MEFKEINTIQTLIELLKTKNPIVQCHILSAITNLSLNDQINFNIRIQGAHKIGQILMENCTPLSDTQSLQDSKVRHVVQLHCLRTLRFLFSIEKNRKAFKLVFPPEIFGAFIDIGNFNRNF